MSTLRWTACLYTLTFALAAPAQTVDLRNYLPAGTQTHRLYNGTSHGQYRFHYVPYDPMNGFWNLYLNKFDLHKYGGQLLIWEKIYASNSAYPENLDCTVTYAHLYVGGGSDLSVVEVGDWLRGDGKPAGCPGTFGALGYQRSTSFSMPATGLNWSGPNGLDPYYSSYQSGYVFRDMGGMYQNTGGEYSTPGLVQLLPTWSPSRGRDGNGVWRPNPGTVYTDVVRMVLYHGTTGSNTCSVDPANPYASYYFHNPGYNTYAIELYLDRIHGILQETLLYDEGTYFSNVPCNTSFPTFSPNSQLMTALQSWQWYLDN